MHQESFGDACRGFLDVDEEQTRVLLYALGFPWCARQMGARHLVAVADGRRRELHSFGYFLAPASVPLADQRLLERCLHVAGQTAGWAQADRALREAEGLTDDQRLYVRAELVRRALSDPLGSGEGDARAVKVLNRYCGVSGGQTRDVLAVAAARTVLYAAPAERDALLESLNRAGSFAGPMLRSAIEVQATTHWAVVTPPPAR